MIWPSLIAESRRLLDQARVIAEASAAQTSEIGHGHPSSQVPPGTFTFTRSTLEQCGWRINEAIARDSQPELIAANRWIAHELDMLQHGPPDRREETIAERGARICANYEGVLAGVVAREERMSVTQVRDIRTEGGRDARTGHKAGKQLLAGSQ